VKPARHPAEERRLKALYRLGILDTPRERKFDDVVEIAAMFCQTPIAVISLVDEHRQWFKAEVGFDRREMPVETSFCAHAILENDLVVVDDLSQDKRFADNPLVTGEPHLRFYAAAPLVSDEGLPLGTLCVYDHKPRTLDEEQRRLLKVLAQQVVAQFRLNQVEGIEKVSASLSSLLTEQQQLISRNEILRREIDHRVRNSLQLIADFLSAQGTSTGDPEVAAQLKEARNRVMAVASVHDRLHRSAEAGSLPVRTFLEDLCASLAETKPAWIDAVRVHAADVELAPDQMMALGLAANELVANAFKHAYDHDRRGAVEVNFAVQGGEGVLTVSDSGIGLPLGPPGERTGGLGTKVLAALICQLGGTITHSRPESGSRFTLRFPIRPI
jgi:two-component sensor histidine kinase